MFMSSNSFLKPFILLIFLQFTVWSCSSEKKSETTKTSKTTKVKPVKTAQIKKDKQQDLVDLKNKGIGPIKSITFGAIDTEMAKQGETIFKQKCTACHKTNKKFIGPAVKDIYKKRAPEWVMNMILNPVEMLEKDPIAKQQLKRFNNVLMINQGLTEADARAVAEYFRTL